MKRGGRLKRTTPLRNSTPLAGGGTLARTSSLARVAMTVKRAVRTSAETSARRIVGLRSAGICEGCGRAQATDWSHRKAASQGGPWCPSNGLHLCRGCHAWAHDNPVEARSVGWHVLSGNNHQTVPALLHRRGWVLLTPAGDFTPTERGAA